MATDDTVIDNADDQGEVQVPAGALLDNDTLANAPLDEDITIPLRREAAEDEEAGDDEATEVEEDEDTEDETPAPQPVTALVDPGDFKPNDYSFEVTTYDEDGKNPKTVKIESADQWDKLLEGDPSFGNTAAFMRAARAVTRLESNIERDKADYDARKTAYDAQQESAQHNEQALTNWQKEIDYLVAQKKLPQITKEQAELDWNDPEVAKQDGVKEQLAVLSYMKAESKRRVAVGLPPISSVIEAYNAKRLDDMEKGASESQKRQAEARKQRGGMVNRVQSAPVKAAPKGMIVGTGGSLDELETFGLM